MNALSFLIVDDNRASRKLLRSVLVGLAENCVMKIDEAANGAEAIQHINASPYHIIFLDIEMPDMNGLDVLREILTAVPEQFVVMVSANATIANVKKTVELGGKVFIVKPYTGEKLKSVLNNYLRTLNKIPS